MTTIDLIDVFCRQSIIGIDPVDVFLSIGAQLWWWARYFYKVTALLCFRYWLKETSYFKSGSVTVTGYCYFKWNKSLLVTSYVAKLLHRYIIALKNED
jgi:hypothetical protein